MEQLGKEPIEEEIPPSWEDFPETVQNAISIFNSLGNRVYPEIGYTGKDYTNLDLLFKHYAIEDQEFVLEILLWLDNLTIEKNNERIKKEYDKMKRSSSKK